MRNILLVCALIVLFPVLTAAQGNAFNFQGRLNDGTNPANGAYDLQFTLYSAITGGTQIGETIQRPNTTLLNGVFSVNLDFGATAFNNPNAVFIEIGVKPNGSPNAFTILGPRQQLTVVPFAVRANSAANADNTTSFNGLDTSDFILNSTTPQSANFNVLGNGRINGSLGIGLQDVPLNPDVKLDVLGNVRFTDSLARTINFGTPNTEIGMSINNGVGRADLRMDSLGTIKFVNGSSGGIPSNTSGIAIDRRGFVGIGTLDPRSRLSLSGGSQWTPSWTASMNLQNASAIGWEANPSGQRFGIGQGTGGLFFFRTATQFGSTGAQPNYDMTITDTGNITQPPGKYGLVKAMLFITPDGNIGQCYNALLNSVTGTCGFVVNRVGTGNYTIDLNQPAGRFFSATSESGYKKLGAVLTSQNVITVTITKMVELSIEGGYYVDEFVDGGFTLIVY